MYDMSVEPLVNIGILSRHMYLIFDFENEKEKAKKWKLYVQLNEDKIFIKSKKQMKSLLAEKTDLESGLSIILKREQSWENREELIEFQSGIRDFMLL